MSPNEPAFPRGICLGLTKREYIATELLGCFARIAIEKVALEGMSEELSNRMDEIMIKSTLILTDKLIAELDKTKT